MLQTTMLVHFITQEVLDQFSLVRLFRLANLLAEKTTERKVYMTQTSYHILCIVTTLSNLIPNL